jgi:hypothetical protein
MLLRNVMAKSIGLAKQARLFGIQRQRIGQMTFDEPERLLGGIHGSNLHAKRGDHARFSGDAFDSPCAFKREPQPRRFHAAENNRIACRW